MTKPENIGAVGIGSLGSKVELQELAAGFRVITYDPIGYTVAQTAVNPFIRASYVKKRSTRVDALEAVIRNCPIVHWTDRPQTTRDIPWLPRASLLVLHSSTMTESIEEAERLQSREEILGSVAVAHLSMNYDLGVAVASDFGEGERLFEHLVDIGLSPRLINSKDHDLEMWDTHGLAVRLSERREELETYEAEGLLPPSVKRILMAIRTNDLRWTSATRASILANPNNPDRHS